VCVSPLNKPWCGPPRSVRLLGGMGSGGGLCVPPVAVPLAATELRGHHDVTPAPMSPLPPPLRGVPVPLLVTPPSPRRRLSSPLQLCHRRAFIQLRLAQNGGIWGQQGPEAARGRSSGTVAPWHGGLWGQPQPHPREDTMATVTTLPRRTR